jgi:hypothetical protein
MLGTWYVCGQLLRGPLWVQTRLDRSRLLHSYGSHNIQTSELCQICPVLWAGPLLDTYAVAVPDKGGARWIVPSQWPAQSRIWNPWGKCLSVLIIIIPNIIPVLHNCGFPITYFTKIYYYTCFSHLTIIRCFINSGMCYPPLLNCLTQHIYYNEPSGSIKCWELPSGCTSCGLLSGTQLHRIS